MKTRYYLAMLAVAGSLCSCNKDTDVDIVAPILEQPDLKAIDGQLVADDYVITWPSTNLKMQVTCYADGNKAGNNIVEGNSYTLKEADTNIEYTFVLKYTDGTNYSKGVITSYTRPGAGRFSGLSMAQIEKAGGYDAKVEWSPNKSAEQILFTANNGGARQISETLSASTTSYTIPDVQDGETWSVTLVAKNSEGTSLPTTATLRIGKLAVAFLSEYASPAEHIANADDDEAYAWLWFQENYPTGTFLPFSAIASAKDLTPYRVIFWIRDLETGVHTDAFRYSKAIESATPSIIEWYKNGGSLLLWSHAVTYVEKLGRIPEGTILGNDNTIGTGQGGFNGDVWKMAVQLAPGEGKFIKDMSTHPIYKGIDAEPAGNTKLIAMKGAGWTEDHNCLFFNYPSALTGLGNQDEACYNMLTKTYGIYPLATWDSQINWISQLNVWEAQQGNTEFQGTLLCVGNGGCEFYMKDAEGKADVVNVPSANAYQKNVERMAKNAIEYLKTR
ncbi:MAG: DUF4960 domain-containing protein [Bacteroidales bacterium]|nr:DUF4960 domain-containing protein [Bacteroidales bacterium]